MLCSQYLTNHTLNNSLCFLSRFPQHTSAVSTRQEPYSQNWLAPFLHVTEDQKPTIFDLIQNVVSVVTEMSLVIFSLMLETIE